MTVPVPPFVTVTYTPGMLPQIHCTGCGSTWEPPKNTEASAVGSVSRHWKKCPGRTGNHVAEVSQTVGNRRKTGQKTARKPSRNRPGNRPGNRPRNSTTGDPMTLRIEPGPADDDNTWPCCDCCTEQHTGWVRWHDQPCDACQQTP